MCSRKVLAVAVTLAALTACGTILSTTDDAPAPVTPDAEPDAPTQSGDADAQGTSLEGGADASDAADVVSRKRVFMTRETLPSGMIVGAAGEASCEAEAPGAKWDVLLDGVSSISGNGPWYRMDRTTLVAPDRAALTTGLTNPISTTSGRAWTGTTTSGMASGVNCANWSGTMGSATAGDPASASTAWLDVGELASCGQRLGIYCFER